MPDLNKYDLIYREDIRTYELREFDIEGEMGRVVGRVTKHLLIDFILSGGGDLMWSRDIKNSDLVKEETPPFYLISAKSVIEAGFLAKQEDIKPNEWIYIPEKLPHERQAFLAGRQVEDESHLIGWFSEEERRLLIKKGGRKDEHISKDINDVLEEQREWPDDNLYLIGSTYLISDVFFSSAIRTAEKMGLKIDEWHYIFERPDLLPFPERREALAGRQVKHLGLLIGNFTDVEKLMLVVP